MYSSEIEPLFALFCVVAFIFGSCIGSFMNVVVWRLPRGESLVDPPSHCPRCGHLIKPWENIPIISWLCLRARCSGCHQPISIKYPIGESATGLLFSLLWVCIYKRNLPLAVVPAYFFLGAALLAVALIDAEHWFIPDEVTFSGMGFAMAMALMLPTGRIALQANPGPDAGALIITGFKELALKAGFDIGQSPIIAAAIDTVLGAAMGFSILFILAWTMKHLLKRQDILPHPDCRIKIDKEGILFENDQEKTPWDELIDKDDKVIIHGKVIKSDGCQSNVSGINAGHNGISIDGDFTPWGKASAIEVCASRMSTPQDAMGRGDAKLLAMCGAFLGADAAIYILLIAALLALIFALGHSLLFRKYKSKLPFGPFLAVSTMLWMMVGNLPFMLLH